MMGSRDEEANDRPKLYGLDNAFDQAKHPTDLIWGLRHTPRSITEEKQSAASEPTHKRDINKAARRSSWYECVPTRGLRQWGAPKCLDRPTTKARNEEAQPQCIRATRRPSRLEGILGSEATRMFLWFCDNVWVVVSCSEDALLSFGVNKYAVTLVSLFALKLSLLAIQLGRKGVWERRGDPSLGSLQSRGCHHLRHLEHYIAMRSSEIKFILGSFFWHSHGRLIIIVSKAPLFRMANHLPGFTLSCCFIVRFAPSQVSISAQHPSFGSVNRPKFYLVSHSGMLFILPPASASYTYHIFGLSTTSITLTGEPLLWAGSVLHSALAP
nr:hypothetical protein Iba_chr03cCG3760 [Ipomoea batatas]